MSTPMRRQYLLLKKQYPDAILFFRLGDFYETFDEDARIVAEVCDVVLTSRPVTAGERVPLAGVPWHSADIYIAKLIHAGYKVAICEQIGEVGQGLVDREVIRVVTPGTLIEPNLLDERRNNYLAAVVFEGFALKGSSPKGPWSHRSSACRSRCPRAPRSRPDPGGPVLRTRDGRCLRR